jgi:hypothetical protein
MAAVHIGVGHANETVIAQLFDVETLADAGPKAVVMARISALPKT